MEREKGRGEGKGGAGLKRFQSIKMKSLLITSDFPPMTSGIATQLYNTWKNLPSERIIVLGPKVAGWEDFDRKQNFRIFRHRLPLGTSPFARILKSLLLIFYVWRIVRKVRVEKIHCTALISTGISGLVFKKFFKIPYCIYVYGGEVEKYKRVKLVHPLIRLILRNAQKIIANSKYTSGEFIRLGIPAEKFVVINPGVDTQKFIPAPKNPEIEKTYGLKNKKVILTVARLVERKGQDMVIKALPRVLEKVSNLVYLIVGEGSQELKLKELVRGLHLETYVDFVGRVPNDALPRYYNACDVFIMPNRETKGTEIVEGFGISFIEANACGKPVIGGRSGGVEDAIVDGVTGLLVDPLNTEQIANAILRFLTDEGYAKQLGDNGRLRVERDFRWELQTQKLKELL